MDDNTLVMADMAASTLRIFGFGFLAGSLFSIMILLVLDWVRSSKESK